MIDKLPPLKFIKCTEQQQSEQRRRPRQRSSSPFSEDRHMRARTSSISPAGRMVESSSAGIPEACYEQRRMRSPANHDGEQGRLYPVLSSSRTGHAYVFIETLDQTSDHSMMLAAPIEGNVQMTSSWQPHATKRVVKMFERFPPYQNLQQYGTSVERIDSYKLGEYNALRTIAKTPEHPYVVPLIEEMFDQHHYFLVMPYLNGGKLSAQVKAHPEGISEGEACRYLLQIVAGLRHLKRHNLAHGDINLNNVVLSKEKDGAEPVCRLIGLEHCHSIRRGIEGEMERVEGMSMEVNNSEEEESSVSPPRPTRRRRIMASRREEEQWFVAPEVLEGNVTDWHAADVFSLGLLLYNCLTGHPLYAKPEGPAFSLLKSGGATGLIYFYAKAYGLRVSSEAGDLISAMLRPCPEDRPSLDEIVNHPFVQSHGPTAKENRGRRFLQSSIGYDEEDVAGRHWKDLTRLNHLHGSTLMRQ